MTDDQKLQDCFRNALGAATAADLAFGSSGWDSVGHIALVSELETAFGIELTPEDITDLTSYAKAKDILGRHGFVLSNR